MSHGAQDEDVKFEDFFFMGEGYPVEEDCADDAYAAVLTASMLSLVLHLIYESTLTERT